MEKIIRIVLSAVCADSLTLLCMNGSSNLIEFPLKLLLKLLFSLFLQLKRQNNKKRFDYGTQIL